MPVLQHVLPAEIVALDQQIRPSSWKMHADVCTIGRSPLCQVIVPYRTVSRLHAKIEYNRPNWVLTDVGSANGTFVNGSRIVVPYRLKDRDLIGLGTFEALLQFLDPSAIREGQ